MQIENHRLKDSNVKFEPTQKNSGEFSPGMPDTIIIHYTASPSLAAAVHTLSKSDTKASAHLIIGREGEIFQLVDFNTIAWHAGVSEFEGRKGFNKFSIGIEIDNYGWLKKSGNRFTTWFERAIDASEVVEARHRNPETTEKFWYRYTEKQIELVQQICELLVKTYNIEHILGHEEISRGRKQDPGPAFPLDKMRNNILAGDRDQDDTPGDTFPFAGTVSVQTSLNIREAPSVAAEKIAKPLPNNQKVTILDEQNNWYKVRTDIVGWVSKSHIRKS